MTRSRLGTVTATLVGMAAVAVVASRGGRTSTVAPAGDPTELVPMSVASATHAGAAPAGTENTGVEAGQGRRLTEPTRPTALAHNVEDLARARPEIVAFEQDFLAERTDAVSARAAEAWILSEVSANAKGLQLTSLDVECRTTLCRVQMAFPQQILQKQGPPLPRGTVWTGKEPIGFFIEALDVEFRVGHLFGGLDSSGTPIVVGYASMPAPAAGR